MSTPTFVFNSYFHKHARAAVAYAPGAPMGGVFLELAVHVDQDSETGEFIAHAPALPAEIGVGDTEQEAIESWEAVLDAWVRTFVTHNGLSGFQARLMDLGFQLLTEPAQAPDGEASNRPRWMVNFRIDPGDLAGSPA